MARIIDLTVPLENGLRGVSIESSRTLERDGWNATTLGLYAHCGTHMDAPLHFGVSDRAIDQIPLDRCIGPAWVVDLTKVQPHALIGVDDLSPTKDKVRAGDGLLLRTGWSQRIGNLSYRNALPRVSVELAQWCVEKDLRLLGVEPPSVADVHNIEELTTIHRILLGADIIIVEGLTNLDQIRSEQVTFMAFPLKVKGGDGSPVRAIAIEK